MDDVVGELRLVNKWLRILAGPVLRTMLEEELTSPELARIYEASDGRDIRSVCKEAQVAYGTVHRRWQEWAGKGMLEPAGRKGRYEKVVSLTEMGLDRLLKKRTKGK